MITMDILNVSRAHIVTVSSDNKYRIPKEGRKSRGQRGEVPSNVDLLGTSRTYPKDAVR